MNKVKAQFGSIQSLVLIVVAVGVLLGVGYVILGEFRDNFNDNSFTVANETTGAINFTGYTLTQASSPGFNSLSITQARNGTSGLVIAAANYTVTDAGVVTNATAVHWPVVHFTYTYLAGDEAYDGIDSAIDATDNITTLLGLVVVIAMVVVILGFVFTIPGARSA